MTRSSSAFEVPLAQIPTGEVIAEIIGGSLGWNENGTVVLEDINLKLVSGELHMVSF